MCLMALPLLGFLALPFQLSFVCSALSSFSIKAHEGGLVATAAARPGPTAEVAEIVATPAFFIHRSEERQHVASSRKTH
jgi:hypothetical protein